MPRVSQDYSINSFLGIKKYLQEIHELPLKLQVTFGMIVYVDIFQGKASWALTRF